MIAFLDGELLEKNVGRVVLNVGGVGYELAVPTSVLAGLPGRPTNESCSTCSPG